MTTHLPTARPTAFQLFLIFSRIALTSFGGGLSGWFMREFVQERKWMTEDEFLNGLALSQALPGVNVKNLAIWIGYRLAGRAGAIAGFLGTILPSAIVVVLLGTVFASLTRFDITQLLLEGAGATAVGLSLSMGLTAAWHIPRKAVPLLIMAATFIAIGVLQLPLIWTVLAAGSVSVALAYVQN